MEDNCVEIYSQLTSLYTIMTRIKTTFLRESKRKLLMQLTQLVMTVCLPQLITGFIKYHTVYRLQKQVYLCFSSADIRLYITDDNFFTTAQRFFVLYDESNTQNIKILGLAELNSHLIDRGLDLHSFYYGQRQRVGK